MHECAVNGDYIIHRDCGIWHVFLEHLVQYFADCPLTIYFLVLMWWFLRGHWGPYGISISCFCRRTSQAANSYVNPTHLDFEVCFVSFCSSQIDHRLLCWLMFILMFLTWNASGLVCLYSRVCARLCTVVCEHMCAKKGENGFYSVKGADRICPWFT